MADEPSLTELIERLRRIRLQEAQVIDQIDILVSSQQEQDRRAEHTRAPVPPNGNWRHTDFRVGDRVRITNGVRAGQVPTAVVTKVTPERVSIITDDGTRTWRARTNLARR